jgi:hypothetical protein
LQAQSQNFTQRHIPKLRICCVEADGGRETVLPHSRELTVTFDKDILNVIIIVDTGQIMIFRNTNVTAVPMIPVGKIMRDNGNSITVV